jgi:molybdopterin/thiamine biosynthesis adenylyltransferase
VRDAAVTPVDRDAVLAGVAARGRIRSARRVTFPGSPGLAVLEGEVDVAGDEVTVCLALPESFPLVLPRVYLRSWDALGFLPHMMPDGFICFADAEGLVQDRRNPVGVAEEALSRAVALLEDGKAGRNRAEFTDEFHTYWARLPGSIYVHSVLELHGAPRWALVADLTENLRMLAGHVDEYCALLNLKPDEQAPATGRALYVPLQPGAEIVPPRHDEPFWSVQEVRRQLLPHVSTEDRARLRLLASGMPRAQEYVFFNLPDRVGGSTLFGIRYSGMGRNHPLLEGGVAKEMLPLVVRRLDRGYLVARGGGTVPLGGRRVLIVGCGAVGGPLAFELARAGVADLTLVDSDTLEPENTFRHPLGRRYWYKAKVDAMKQEIEANLPYVRVTPVKDRIEDALVAGELHLENFDLVVLATGNPTVELEVNARLRASAASPPAVFTWLEPLGLGGHALLTGNGKSSGCYECLYTPPEEGVGGALDNRASFAAPGQRFGRALNGCGSLHTPYGSADALRTAALTARLVVDALLSEEAGNPLRSWKGDGHDFGRAGFETSTRYAQTVEDLDARRYAYATPRCAACGDFA